MKCTFCDAPEMGNVRPPMCSRHADFFMTVATMHRLNLLVSIESVTAFVQEHASVLVNLAYTVDEIPELMQQLAAYIEEM